MPRKQTGIARNTARTTISTLLRQYGFTSTCKEIDDRKAVFLNSETDARFFGKTWKEVLNQVISFTSPLPLPLAD